MSTRLYGRFSTDTGIKADLLSENWRRGVHRLLQALGVRTRFWVLAQTLGLLAFFLAGMAWLQFSTPNLVGNDGYYHIKMAYILRTEGLRPAFPWLPLTVLSPDRFVDHHYLFHVLLVPFTLGDLRLGAKWGSVLFAGLAGLSFWWVLDRRKVPWAWLWAAGVFAVSDAFLYRMAMPRVQSLSLALLFLAVGWMLEGKHRRLLAVGFLYVWAYNAFPLLLALAGLYGMACYLVERRLEWRPLFFSGVGILAGTVVNPYFPQNLVFLYHHLAPKIGSPTAIPVGSEWYPYTTGQLLKNTGPGLLLLAGGWVALAAYGGERRKESVFFTLSVLFFGLMLMQARRFVEYFPPFALLFAAYHLGALHRRAQSVAARRLGALVLAVGLLLGASYTLPRARKAVQASAPYTRYQKAAQWLANNTPAGSRVFQTDWDDFPRLFFYNHHNTYLVGLDPVFLARANPGLYRVWVDVTQGKIETVGPVVRLFFGAEYIFTDRKHSAFLRVAANDPQLKEVYRDEFAVIFRVSE